MCFNEWNWKIAFAAGATPTTLPRTASRMKKTSWAPSQIDVYGVRRHLKAWPHRPHLCPSGDEDQQQLLPRHVPATAAVTCDARRVRRFLRLSTRQRTCTPGTPEQGMGHSEWPMTQVTHWVLDPWPMWPMTHGSPEPSPHTSARLAQIYRIPCTVFGHCICTHIFKLLHNCTCKQTAHTGTCKFRVLIYYHCHNI